jgi:hypothetical protein
VAKLEGHLQKGQEMQKVIGEEFAQDLNEGETRWTKEGLLDIREEVTQDVTGEGA